jgi:hypothetical protein
MRYLDLVLWPAPDGVVMQLIMSGPHLGDTQKIVNLSFADWQHWIEWMVAHPRHAHMRHVQIVPPSSWRRRVDLPASGLTYWSDDDR